MINHDDDTEAAPSTPASRGLGFLLPHSPIAEMALCAEMPGPRTTRRIEVLGQAYIQTPQPDVVDPATGTVWRHGGYALDESANDEAFDAIEARLAALRAAAGSPE